MCVIALPGDTTGGKTGEFYTLYLSVQHSLVTPFILSNKLLQSAIIN